MSLHSIIEPAGTLLTGWTLVPEDKRKTADVRNKDEASPVPNDGERPVSGGPVSGGKVSEVG